MRRAIEQIQDFGIEVDIWKIEGVDAREDAEMLAEQTRKGEGREGVVCVLLGRGASDEKVDHWLRQAAPVEGFIGFAIGRSIWWDALKGFLDGDLDRAAAAGEGRRQLPALRQGLRRGGVGGARRLSGAREPRPRGRTPCGVRRAGLSTAESERGGRTGVIRLRPCGCGSRSPRSRRPSPRRSSRIASAASGWPGARRCAAGGGTSRRRTRPGSMRFALLVLTLIATAVVVTIAMFQTLYYVMG